jgi:hypothetical protein
MVGKDGRQMMAPCGPSDPAGKAMTMMDLTGDQLKLPDVSLVNASRRLSMLNLLD